MRDRSGMGRARETFRSGEAGAPHFSSTIPSPALESFPACNELFVGCLRLKRSRSWRMDSRTG